MPCPLPPPDLGTIRCLGLSLNDSPARWRTWAEGWTTTDEQARAARFHFPIDGLRHLLGRAVVRFHLATWLGERPGSFLTNPWGKPEAPDQPFQFSLSHGGNAVLVAFTQSVALGVDVEALAAIREPLALADQLHPEEALDLRQQPHADLAPAFLRCWTRKEAVIKALGLGLSFPLNGFQVATGASPVNWLLQSPDQGAAWTTADLPVSSGHHGCVAARQAGLVVDFQEWAGPGAGDSPV